MIDRIRTERENFGRWRLPAFHFYGGSTDKACLVSTKPPYPFQSGVFGMLCPSSLPTMPGISKMPRIFQTKSVGRADG